MSAVKSFRLPGGFALPVVVFLLSIAVSMQSFAQQASGSGSPNAALEALAQKWNDARNKADMPALIATFHPSDRPAAEVYYTGHQAANVALRVLQISKIAGDRYEIQVERSWGGSRPGKRKDSLHASELNGEWFLRIPGGSLVLPPGKMPVAKPAQEPAPVARAPQAPTAAGSQASTMPVQPWQTERSAPAVAAPNAPAPMTSTAAPSSPPAAAPAPARAPEKSAPLAQAQPAAKAPEKSAAPAQQAQVPGKAPEKAADPPVVQKFDAWVRICEGKAVSRSRCFLEASLASAADKKPIMRWRVQVLDDGGAASLIMVPADVTLGAGLTLGLAKEQPTPVPFRACGAGGCEVRFNMEPQLLTTVTQRDTVPVKFVNQSGNTIDFAVPMKGFKQAVNSLGGKSR